MHHSDHKKFIIVLDFIEKGGASRMMEDLAQKIPGTDFLFFAGLFNGSHPDLKKSLTNINLLTFEVFNFSSTFIFYLSIFLSSFISSFKLLKNVSRKTTFVLNMSCSGLGIILNPFFLLNKKVFLFHGALSLEIKSRNQTWSQRSKLSFFLYKYLQKFVMGNCSRIVFFSQYSKKILTNYFSIKLNKISPALIPSFSTPATSLKQILQFKFSPKQKFLFCSRIEPRKGFAILAKAVKFIPKNKLNNCLFIVTGEIMEDNYFIQNFTYLKENFLLPFFIFLPALDRKTLFQLYKNIDCTLMLSTQLETLGLVTLESLSFSKPVIGFNKGATKGLLKKLAAFNKLFLINNPNPESLAKSICEYYLLKDREKSLADKIALESFQSYRNSQSDYTDLLALINHFAS